MTLHPMPMLERSMANSAAHRPVLLRRGFLKTMATAALTALLAKDLLADTAGRQPNILWLVSEDNMPLLGCYGDALARTPNLDGLAREGIRYSQAFAHTSVCAPSRFSIVTGAYACAMGTEGMRSRWPIPARIRPYPLLFREAGYYCSNNHKTDYNYACSDKDLWDDCSNQAHYRNSHSGQPFFAVFNSGITHESGTHRDMKNTVTDPSQIDLPPYHPDTPEMRGKWAQYYDRMAALDTWVGQHLRDLEASGQADNTIVFYYSDHAGVLPRSKRYLYQTGTRVPLLVRFGKNFAHLAPQAAGGVCDRLVGLSSLAPTALSLAGLPVPTSMHGRPFLGPQTATPETEIFFYRTRMDERIDCQRGLYDGRYRYIRNYLPRRPLGQHVEYLWKSPAMQSWEKEFRAGRCNDSQRQFFLPKAAEELYETSHDPWEVNNLAGDANLQPVLEKMRANLRSKQLTIRDAGLIPEAMMKRIAETEPVGDYVAKDSFPMARLIETAEMASNAAVDGRLGELTSRLADPEPAIRFWAANGLCEMGSYAKEAIPALTECLTDQWADVRIAAAEALYLAGAKDRALPLLLDSLSSSQDQQAALHAGNVLSFLAEKDPAILPAVEQVRATLAPDNYNQRILMRMKQL